VTILSFANKCRAKAPAFDCPPITAQDLDTCIERGAQVSAGNKLAGFDRVSEFVVAH
jgi:hypothetical protein